MQQQHAVTQKVHFTGLWRELQVAQQVLCVRVGNRDGGAWLHGASVGVEAEISPEEKFPSNINAQVKFPSQMRVGRMVVNKLSLKINDL
ncbi:hypothetical protein [Comamonas sp. SCN 65-56]|uniref:hypothetical protein n=1 Tax=Comamonas sp. SCN 65-56 TaxID=1660095 RepID=UPI0025C6027A|nr:hypothetical protein [Comamonas sp. SCN 65-56]